MFFFSSLLRFERFDILISSDSNAFKESCKLNLIMRALILSLLLFFLYTNLFAQTMTDGSFYVYEGKSTYKITTNDKKSASNILLPGVTYRFSDGIYDISVESEPLTLLFSNDVNVKLSPNSEFSITEFGQEVLNFGNPPQKLQSGVYSLNVSLQKGEATIIRNDTNSNSMCIFSTKYADFELLQGKIVAKVTDKSVIIHVLDGLVRVHEDRPTVEVVGVGNMIIAVPFLDPASGLEDKAVVSIKKSNISNSVTNVTDVMFAIVDGKLVGIKK